ncbi:MAG: hypothetical protein SYR96_38875, partial [Actinomycetota bacterium]|nr:hypothetical protein [Actinomycetota bacterium]
MSSDERQDSLAAQAAAWVPPWERAPRPPDREFQERAEAEASGRESEPDVGEELGQAGLSEDDDFDPAFEGPNPRTREVEGDESGGTPAVDGLDDDAADSPVGQVSDPGVEEPALSEPGDGSAGVDAPSELGDGSAGVDGPVGVPGREGIETPPGAEMPLPEPIEEAAEAADADEPGTPVDAPLPADGDDAGDVFDAAADDDVSDDGEMDVPFADEVPPSNSADDNDAGRAGHAAGHGESEPADSEPAENDRAEGADARGDRLEGARSQGGADEAAVVDATAAGAGATAEGGDEPAKRAKGAKARAVPGQKRRAGEPLGTGDESSPRTGNSDVDLPGLADDAELAGALEAIM